MDRILEGDLAGFEAPDLLFLLEAGQKTGALVLERPDQENKVFLREGRPVFATSTMPGLRLGDILVRQGRADRGAIERALADAGPGGRIGSSLLAAGLVDEGELASLLKIQISEIVFDCLGWSGGTFTFYDRTPPPLTAVTLDADLVNLLVEAFRRQDQGGGGKARDTGPSRCRGGCGQPRASEERGGSHGGGVARLLPRGWSPHGGRHRVRGRRRTRGPSPYSRDWPVPDS